MAGAQTDYEATTETIMKGLIEIQPGDSIDFLCDYYHYDGTYSDTYYLGEQMTATGDWVIGNAPLATSTGRCAIASRTCTEDSTGRRR